MLSEQGQFSTPPEASLTDKIPPHSSLDLGGCSLHHQEALPGLVCFPGSLNFVNCIILAQSLRPMLPEQGQFSTPPASLTAKIPPPSSLDLGGRSLHHQETLPDYVASECSLNQSSSRALLLLEHLYVQLQLKPALVGQPALAARLDQGSCYLHQQVVAAAEPGSPAGLYLDCCCPQALQPLSAQVASQGCLDSSGGAWDQLGVIYFEASKP